MCNNSLHMATHRSNNIKILPNFQKVFHAHREYFFFRLNYRQPPPRQNLASANTHTNGKLDFFFFLSDQLSSHWHFFSDRCIGRISPAKKRKAGFQFVGWCMNTVLKNHIHTRNNARGISPRCGRSGRWLRGIIPSVSLSRLTTQVDWNSTGSGLSFIFRKEA